jgi:prolyl-tRNA synthetase
MLDIYKSIYNDIFAIPVLLGKKSEARKLIGSDFSTAIQIILPNNGIGIQVIFRVFMEFNKFSYVLRVQHQLI